MGVRNSSSHLQSLSQPLPNPNCAAHHLRIQTMKQTRGYASVYIFTLSTNHAHLSSRSCIHDNCLSLLLFESSLDPKDNRTITNGIQDLQKTQSSIDRR